MSSTSRTSAARICSLIRSSLNAIGLYLVDQDVVSNLHTKKRTAQAIREFNPGCCRHGAIRVRGGTLLVVPIVPQGMRDQTPVRSAGRAVA
jgi:hypothetical protein